MAPPITVYLLKATEYCNLNCPYCYMFNLEDQSYKKKPKVMSLEIVRAMATKAVNLARQQDVHKLTVSLHGGEPLLAGINWFRSAIEILRREGEKQQVHFAFLTQTNGVLLNEKWLNFFESEKFTIGISIDGPPEIHNKTRINFSGRGSYKETLRGLKLAQNHPDVLGGVLCVINPNTIGIEIYHHLIDIGADKIDFLWPLDHNWNSPPPQPSCNSSTPYADYLIPIFNEWWNKDRKFIKIRYFSQLIKNILGARGGLDSLGGNPISIISIDSDGSIEPVDSLKACGDGFTNMGLNVLTDPIERVYEMPLFQAAIAGQTGLCVSCRSCPLHDICGGGYLPHRYSQYNGFDNPTVYCRDMWKLTTHIIDAVHSAAG